MLSKIYLWGDIRVVSILKNGYILPFKVTPPLTKNPIPMSKWTYQSPQEQLPAGGFVIPFGQKVKGSILSGHLQFLFLVPKPNNRWRPILNLSSLNKFLKGQTYKMETPESMRLSLQTGKCVSSLDFSDT